MSSELKQEPWDTITAYGSVDDMTLHPILRRAYRVACLIERAPHASIEQTAASSAAFDLVKELYDAVLRLKGEAMLLKAKADAYDHLIADENTRAAPPSAEPVAWSPGREYADRYKMAVSDEWVRGFDACHFAREVEDLNDEMEASRHD